MRIDNSTIIISSHVLFHEDNFPFKENFLTSNSRKLDDPILEMPLEAIASSSKILKDINNNKNKQNTNDYGVFVPNNLNQNNNIEISNTQNRVSEIGNKDNQNSQIGLQNNVKNQNNSNKNVLNNKNSVEKHVSKNDVFVTRGQSRKRKKVKETPKEI